MEISNSTFITFLFVCNNCLKLKIFFVALLDVYSGPKVLAIQPFGLDEPVIYVEYQQ